MSYIAKDQGFVFCPATTDGKVKKKDEKFLILFLHLESCLTKALSFV